jgi:hypothetical protein
MTLSVPYMMLKFILCFMDLLFQRAYVDEVRLCLCFFKVGSTLLTVFLEEVQCLRVVLPNSPKSVVSSSVFHLRLETNAVVEIPEYELSRDL